MSRGGLQQGRPFSCFILSVVEEPFGGLDSFIIAIRHGLEVIRSVLRSCTQPSRTIPDGVPIFELIKV